MIKLFIKVVRHDSPGAHHVRDGKQLVSHVRIPVLTDRSVQSAGKTQLKKFWIVSARVSLGGNTSLLSPEIIAVFGSVQIPLTALLDQ